MSPRAVPHTPSGGRRRSGGAPVPARRLRISIIVSSADDVIRLRRALLVALLERGHQIQMLSETFSSAARAELADLGLTTAHFVADDGRVAWLANRRDCADISRKLQAFAPDIVWVYDGALLQRGIAAAAKRSSARTVVMFRGLPPSLHMTDTSPSKADALAKRQMAKTLATADVVICHNKEDAQALSTCTTGTASAAAAASIVRVAGAGVDLGHFAAAPLPATDGPIRFVMISRLDDVRGVATFCRAATAAQAALGADSARMVFQLIGSPGRSADRHQRKALSDAYPSVDVHDGVDDVRDALAAAHVVVYPAAREGMPPLVLEAMAVGRGIITTRTPGCRETVDECINGILVDAGDERGLAAAFLRLERNRDLLACMARASRAKAERSYDQRDINLQMIACLEGVAATTP